LKKNNKILVLAAGDIRNKFSFVKNNCSSPALIPVNTKPLANYVLNNLSELTNDAIYLVVDDFNSEEVQSELFSVLEKTKTTLISVQNSNNVVETLIQALDKTPLTETVTILLVTTIPFDTAKNNEIFVDSNFSMNTDWSVIQLESNNIKQVILPKGDPIKQLGHAFTGYFNAKSSEITKALGSMDDTSDLIYLVNLLMKGDEVYTTSKTKWVDCGHEVNYQKTKKELINSRSFNKMIVTEKGQIIKKSEHGQKLKNETNYVHQLPVDIQAYYPIIIEETSLADEEYSYVMDYFSAPNIAEIMLYWNIKVEQWETIFDRFSTFFSEFKKHKTTFSIEQFKNFYHEKTFGRIDAFLKQLTPTKSIVEKKIWVNGHECETVFTLNEYIEQKIETLFHNANFCIMHGDFCFNNILFNPSSEDMKLIDARGSFSEDAIGIYGDLLYDLAKLAHSSIYGYDYLVNDLFTLSENNDNYHLQFLWRENRNVLVDLTNDIISNNNYDQNDIKFVVGLLFLSMPPLHSDSQKRQKAMYVHGLMILNECYNGEKKNMS
jgi:hypothetical protein